MAFIATEPPAAVARFACKNIETFSNRRKSFVWQNERIRGAFLQQKTIVEKAHLNLLRELETGNTTTAYRARRA